MTSGRPESRASDRAVLDHIRTTDRGAASAGGGGAGVPANLGAADAHGQSSSSSSDGGVRSSMIRVHRRPRGAPACALAGLLVRVSSMTDWMADRGSRRRGRGPARPAWDHGTSWARRRSSSSTAGSCAARRRTRPASGRRSDAGTPALRLLDPLDLQHVVRTLDDVRGQEDHEVGLAVGRAPRPEQAADQREVAEDRAPCSRKCPRSTRPGRRSPWSGCHGPEPRSGDGAGW